MTDVLRTVGRYELHREIARGAMGIVYLARQTGLDREVALKELALRADEPESLARFIRESRLAASLSNPNIVSVFDSSSTRECPTSGSSPARAPCSSEFRPSSRWR